MITIVRTPQVGANDKCAVLNTWLKKSGQRVASGDLICSMETTKTSFEVEAPADGFLYYSCESGTQLETNKAFALVSEHETNDAIDTLEEIVSNERQESHTQSSMLTKKAELLIKQNQLNIDDLVSEYGDKKIKEQDVRLFLLKNRHLAYRHGFASRERVGVIGGASGGGALIVIDAIIRNPDMQAVCVFDQNDSYKGESILGVPIVGSIELLDQYLNSKLIDKVIIAFNRNLVERENTFKELRQAGVPFCNVIDPSVEVRNLVEIGIGNVILSNSYIGPCSHIGDNNFITSGTHIEHGNRLGDHCAFGPSVATSGNVDIGDRVRFASGIFVEPDVTIGDDCIISSGAVIRGNIEKNHIVKVEVSHSIKNRNIT
jgi:sugar O-acyltransferase (sialic acid O-acetyltransferase NeuD family)